MTINSTRMSEERPSQPPPQITDLIERLSHFDGPPDQFLVNLLAVQCVISGASGGSIFRAGAKGQAEVVAIYPPLGPDAAAPPWLAEAIETLRNVQVAGGSFVRALRSAEDLYGQPPDRFVIVLPLRGTNEIRGLAVFFVETGDFQVLEACRQRLELTISLLNLYEMRLTLQHRQFDLRRLRMAMEVLSSINEPEKFAGAGMAMCNELAARWGCHRVGLGFLKGRYVHLKALSHTEKFSRKMKLIQDVEAAMEECLDQDVEVVYPPAADATYVSRAAAELSKMQGPSSVIGFPLRRAGEVVAVILLERGLDKPFNIDEIESLRLTCDLCTARLSTLFEHDRWFGARLAAATRKGLAVAVGPKHTWIKVGAIAACALILFMIFAKGDYQAEGQFVIEATQRQVISTPYDGKLAKVNVDVGDPVVAGKTVLAQMDTEELQKNLEKARAEREKFVKQADQAQAAALMDPAKRVEVQSAEAQAREVTAQIELLEYQLSQSKLLSPIDGVVAVGDLKKYENKTFKIGDPLFEVCPIESLRAEISIPEDQIADVRIGNKPKGDLATQGRPGDHIDFTVERINPVAELASQKNVFKVRAQFNADELREKYSWLRPGMEGVAKINIDRRSYGQLWTRRLVNWVRMKLWI